jgi:two-component system KDP operon response regulator KdpE
MTLVARRGLVLVNTAGYRYPALDASTPVRSARRRRTSASMNRLPVVLVVDDDDYVRLAVQAMLRGIRCEVVTAATGGAGLELARIHHPDLAILDVGLPDTDGYQLAYELRSEEELAGMRIVFLTAHLPDATAVEVVGGNLFLGKPFRMQTLLEAVRSQLAGSTAGPTATSSAG